MDGNNRWAKKRGLRGIAGHKAGIESVRQMLEGCREHNIEVLTIFAFSSENWRRPRQEVNALMSLFKHYLASETKNMQKDNVRLQVIGNRRRFDKSLLRALEKAEKLTEAGERRLVIAADYGGRWDIANAARQMAEKVLTGERLIDDIDEDYLHRFTCLSDLPPLDLLIRTGGEYRISNFLLWQAAYAELYFSDLLWPDFNREALDAAIMSYSNRQRRFGLNGEQIIGGQTKACSNA